MYTDSKLTLPSDAFAPVTDTLPSTQLIDWSVAVGDKESVEIELDLPVPPQQVQAGARYYGGLLTGVPTVHMGDHSSLEALNASDEESVLLESDIEWSWGSLASIGLYAQCIRSAVADAEEAVRVGTLGESAARKALRSWVSALENLHYYAVVGDFGLLGQVFQIGKIYQASIALSETLSVQRGGTPYIPKFVQGWVDELGV
ncbi:hypothetical protein [Streptomyces sp. UNOC14_S4]|uniref:hypothetical protein n=1 Tax=Streptomyces sp. UNOC14_S4 TaxID=2872340 RepID=UPI001E33E4BE|nr:hypothetical protein [Streptomyces sp. UNOC14_S4]MCC3765996.1 hypothetical protein [Streptomyces sp. UNOC14_S4]